MRICLDGQAASSRSVVALGMFDGLHLGHQVLLKRAKALAKRQNAIFVASTFTTHPMRMIRPEKCPPMLTTFEERRAWMEELGVELLCAQPFDQSVMNTAPEEFIARLCERLHPCRIVVGYNHTFGRKGEGNPAILTALGKIFGFAVEVVPKIALDGNEVSSTAVRELLAQGLVEEARRMLWRPYGREAMVLGGRKEECWLRMLGDGKQDVPAGRYRVLADHGGESLPGTLHMHGRGRATLFPAGDLFAETEVRLQFYHRLGQALGGRKRRKRSIPPPS